MASLYHFTIAYLIRFSEFLKDYLSLLRTLKLNLLQVSTKQVKQEVSSLMFH